MKLLPLEQFSNQLQAGAPLKWGIRDSSGQLLLARGRVLIDNNMIQALLDRGTFVDVEEVNRAHPEASAALKTKKETAPARWDSLQARLSTLLRSPTSPIFLDGLRDSIDQLDSLVERNSDLIIYLIMRHDHTRYAQYGVAHSLHVASLCSLLAQRMSWSNDLRKNVIGAALSMNLSIIELQGRMATQSTPLTDDQRQQIQNHPLASAQLLRNAGLTDTEWLHAVEQHHEQRGSTGYPGKLNTPSELSQLIHFVDCFTAKHSARAGRSQQPAQQAARDLYIQSQANPLAALLIKEFGIYPPGCFVKLASGETAIVIKRGANANTPIVAALINRNGDALSQPIPRDSSISTNAIVSTIPNKAVLVCLSIEKLYDLHNG